MPDPGTHQALCRQGCEDYGSSPNGASADGTVTAQRTHTALKREHVVQVEAVRKHAVYSGLCSLLLQMAATWSAAVVAALQAASDAGASAQQSSPSLMTADRLLAALRLLLHSAAHSIDNNNLVRCAEDLECLVTALATLAANLRPQFIIRTPASPSAPNPSPTMLPEAQLVAGCSAFLPWFEPLAGASTSDTDRLQDLPSGVPGTHAELSVSAVRIAGVSADCSALAVAATSVHWHVPTAAFGQKLAAVATQLKRLAQSETSADAPAADTPTVAARAMSLDSNDLDEVMMLPGDGWHQPPLDGAPLSPEDDERAQKEAARSLFMTPPPREHTSLAAALHLPSSLHLGVWPSSGILGEGDDDPLSAGGSSAGNQLRQSVEQISISGDDDPRVEDAAQRQEGLSSGVATEQPGSLTEGEACSGSPLLDGHAGTRAGQDAGEEGDGASSSSDAGADKYAKELHERKEIGSPATAADRAGLTLHSLGKTVFQHD
jgi:hypothetical protein